MTTDVD